jgi:hypothetical protein
MKRIATVFACALVVGGFQAHKAEAQTIGFKLGQSWSKLDVDPQDQDETLDQLSAFGGGGFIRFGFAGLALQAEVLALTKGTKEEDEAGAGDAELKLEYIEVPITAMFSLGNGPYVFAGPTFAFETGCELESSDETVEVPCENDTDPDAINRKKLDIGVTGGVGFQFPAGPGSILVEGRYTHGLTNLNDSATSDTQKIRNRSFAAFAGYAIPIGGR